MRQYPVTRSNGFSRKLEKRAAAVALHYNFIRIHRTRVTPAMAVGVTARLWEVSDLVALLVAVEDGKKAA